MNSKQNSIELNEKLSLSDDKGLESAMKYLSTSSSPVNIIPTCLYAEMSYIESSLVGIISQIQNGMSPSEMTLPDISSFFGKFCAEIIMVDNSKKEKSNACESYKSHIDKIMQIQQLLLSVGVKNYSSLLQEKNTTSNRTKFTFDYHHCNRSECVAEFNVYFDKNFPPYVVKIKIYKKQRNGHLYYEGNMNIEMELDDLYLASNEYSPPNFIGCSVEEALVNTVNELLNSRKHMARNIDGDMVYQKEYQYF